MLSRSRAVGLVSLGLLAALPLAGQAVDSSPAVGSRDTVPAGPHRWEVGLVGALAVPSGDFATYVGLGGGFGLHGARYLDDERRVALRLDLSWTVYGHETVRVPLSPTIPFVDVKVTTENGIGSFALGPQVWLGRGRISPWVRASIGISDFATTTSVTGEGQDEAFASSTNFDDATLALAAGGGLHIALSRGSAHPIGLDVGAIHIWHGETEYLREGGITTDGSGNVRLDTIRSKTNLFAISLGFAVALR